MSPEHLFERYKQIRELVKRQTGYVPSERDWARVPHSYSRLCQNYLFIQIADMLAKGYKYV